MSAPFVGEIRVFPFNFAPRGWAFCSGQLLPISQNTALFSILGTTYGGDGKSTFGLPNFIGNAPNHFGQGPGLSFYSLGEITGSTGVALLSGEMPAHTHALFADTTGGTSQAPAGNLLGKAASRTYYYYGPGSSATQMATLTVGPNNGGAQPHENRQPYLVLNYCIAMQGIFPPRS